MSRNSISQKNSLAETHPSLTHPYSSTPKLPPPSLKSHRDSPEQKALFARYLSMLGDIESEVISPLTPPR